MTRTDLAIQQHRSGAWLVVHGVVCLEIDGHTWWPTREAAEAAADLATTHPKEN